MVHQVEILAKKRRARHRKLPTRDEFRVEVPPFECQSTRRAININDEVGNAAKG